MGVSTDGQICFGIVFEEGTEFPWEGDIEDWWLREVKKFRNTRELYNEDGGYLNGVVPTEDEIGDYYQERREFMKNNPCPVSLVNYCSGDYPTYILAVPSSVKVCSRGFPTKLRVEDFVVTEKQIQSLKDFCSEHGLQVGPDEEPAWWLSSYWG